MRQLALDKVIFVPAYISPFASTDDAVSVENRLVMLENTLKAFKFFEVSTYELDKKIHRIQLILLNISIKT